MVSVFKGHSAQLCKVLSNKKRTAVYVSRDVWGNIITNVYSSFANVRNSECFALISGWLSITEEMAAVVILVTPRVILSVMRSLAGS